MITGSHDCSAHGFNHMTQGKRIMDYLALDHAALNVSNLEASRKFYSDGLGLKEIARPNFDFDGIWYGLGKDQQLHLIVQEDLPRAERRLNHHFALRVTDVAATQKELETRGIKIALGPNPRPDGVVQIFVIDPDGYVIELSNNL